MIPSSVDYIRALSIGEAIQLLKNDPAAKILAGGHSLIPAMKLRLNAPSVLIDIARIPELNFIRDRGKYIAIGAATTHGTIAHHHTTAEKLTLIAQAAELIGDVQVRNKGTIGGAIAHADPASDWPAVLIAANATIEVQGAFGERNIPAEEFFVGFFTTELQEGEIITEIKVPEPNRDTVRSSYQKFMQPASRFAIVGCAAQLTLDGNIITDARVAFNGVGDHAYRATSVENALIGQEFTTENCEAASVYATEGVEMVLSDHYADEAYRRHIANIYCKRALLACMYD
jgi:aerobic carbon-monoxide dehydrogenase medium subunit